MVCVVGGGVAWQSIISPVQIMRELTVFVLYSEERRGTSQISHRQLGGSRKPGWAGGEVGRERGMAGLLGIGPS